jgi:hypothetical protein
VGSLHPAPDSRRSRGFCKHGRLTDRINGAAEDLAAIKSALEQRIEKLLAG